MPPKLPDHYKTLEVAPDAETADIKRAYRALALKHHPDKSSEASATARLAAINCAWDIIGDTERRREYDMQREADGETRHRRHGPLAIVRSIILGSAQSRSFRWASGMPYLRRHSVGALHEHLRRGRTALLFLHLGGSPRAARSAPAMLEVRRQLRGAVHVAAVDVEAEPQLARSLMPGGSMDLPAAVMITAAAGARHFAAPLNATELVDAAVDSLPELPSVCTSAHLHGLLSTADGIPRLALALVLPSASKALRTAARVASAAGSPALQCARVPHSRCTTLPAELLTCPGVALLWAPPQRHRDGMASYLRRCVSAPDEALVALREHAASVRSAPPGLQHGLQDGLQALRTAVGVVAETPGARAAAAIGDAIRGSPVGHAMEAALAISARELVKLQAPLGMFMAGLLVWSVRAIALGGPLPWARHRGSGGRRLGRLKGRRRASSRTPAGPGPRRADVM